MSAAPSPYECLPSTRSIRLLSVVIFEISNVYLHIRTADLDDKTLDFDALSYTWGSPVDTPSAHEEYGPNNDVEVVLSSSQGQCPFRIGRNLYEALLDISKRSHRPLWVDAVCINQSDVDEKTRQVAIMGDIYSKASKTLVWMGIDDTSTPIFHHIRYIHGEFCDNLVVPAENRFNGPISWENSRDPASDLLFRCDSRTLRLSRQAVDALHSFYLTRRYLYRVWVVQEVYHGNAVVLLDGRLFDFDRFIVIAGTLGGLGVVMLTYASAGAHASSVNLLTMHPKLIDILVTRGRDKANGSSRLQRAGNTTRAYFEIMIRLRQMSLKEATDPRDYLFAFHSIAKTLSGEEGFLPGYRLSTREVYFAFTCEALKHTLEVLTLGEGSWVPDYAKSFAPVLAVAPFLDVRAGGSFQPIIIGEDQTMMVAAQRCSSLAQTFQFTAILDAEVQTNSIVAAEAYELYRQALTFLQGCGVSDAEGLLRVVTMQLEGTSSDFAAQMIDMTKLLVLEGVAAEDHEVMDRLFELLPAFDHVPDVGILSRMRQRFAKWLADEPRADRESLGQNILHVMDRKPSIPEFLLTDHEIFFVTEDGRFGRTKEDAAQEDEIWLLQGARAPFVLRKKGNNTYTLVAEAIVPGVMFGEMTVNGILSSTETIGLLR